jgi:hypothetical protein
MEDPQLVINRLDVDDGHNKGRANDDHNKYKDVNTHYVFSLTPEFLGYSRFLMF